MNELAKQLRRATGDESRDECEWLNRECERLKRGDFTPEEFQALCHHLDEKPGCTRELFEAGCREYTDKIFGTVDLLSRVQALEAQVRSLDRRLTATGTEMIG